MDSSHSRQDQAVNFVAPTNLPAALSQIQHFYLFEKRGQPLDKEFFTVEHQMAYMVVSVKSAVIDSLIFVAVFLFGGAFIHFLEGNVITQQTSDFLFWKVNSSPEFWMMKIASFSGLIVSTILCCWMGIYYVGTVPRKAINILYATRAVFLVTLSGLSFYVLSLAFSAMSESTIIRVCSSLYNIYPSAGLHAYQFLQGFLKRALFESSIMTIVASTISSILPVISIALFRVIRRRKKTLGVDR